MIDERCLRISEHVSPQPAKAEQNLNNNAAKDFHLQNEQMFDIIKPTQVNRETR